MKAEKAGVHMSPSVTTSLYKFICQKLKEGWNVEKFSAYFGVTRRRAQILIEQAVKYECGDQAPHTRKNLYRKEVHSHGRL